MKSPIGTVSAVYRLLDAVVPSRGPNDYGTLATTGPDGLACARTVVLRGFDAAKDHLWIDTHLRTEKVKHLRLHPDAEVCLWLARKQVQLRIRAEWRVIDAVLAYRSGLADLYRRAWEDQPLASQRLYGDVEEGIIPKDFAVLLGTIYRIDAIRLRRPPAYEQYVHERKRSTWESARER